MIYLWENTDAPYKYYAEYDWELSPDYYLLRRGNPVTLTDFTQCDGYVRSSSFDPHESEFVIFHLRHIPHSAYIFTPDGLSFNASGVVSEVPLRGERLRELRAALGLPLDDVDMGPVALSDAQLSLINTYPECPPFSRTPILRVNVKQDDILKRFDSFTNNSSSPLVNQKIIDILLDLIPDEVQFFDAKLICKDGILTNYKLLNITQKVMGLDRERSVFSTFQGCNNISSIKSLRLLPNCMGPYQLARDAEYFSNILVTDKIKAAFEREKVKGVKFVSPEERFPIRYC